MFPIALWIPHNYPYEGPFAYVKPASDMAIRPGQHVSGEGRIYHPYLNQWGRYWDVS
jgi:ESCRT-I complex subunit TSG101